MKSEYDMTVDRKAVKRNLMNLIDFGYEIEYSESVRMVPNKATGKLEESYILSDFYLVRDFTDSELRLLIDSLLFSKHIPIASAGSLSASWRASPIGISVHGSNTFKLYRICLCTVSSFFTPSRFWTRRSASSARSPLRTTAMAPTKNCIREETAPETSANISSIPIKSQQPTALLSDLQL